MTVKCVPYYNNIKQKTIENGNTNTDIAKNVLNPKVNGNKGVCKIIIVYRQAECEVKEVQIFYNLYLFSLM